jgi:hypothetical protein
MKLVLAFEDRAAAQLVAAFGEGYEGPDVLEYARKRMIEHLFEYVTYWRIAQAQEQGRRQVEEAERGIRTDVGEIVRQMSGIAAGGR